MTNDEYNEAFEAGKRDAARELQPLVDAITDAIFLFNEVGKLSAPTKDQRALANKFRDMGKQLERCLALSGLLNARPPEDEEYERRKAAWIAQRT